MHKRAIIEMADTLATELAADVALATTREEHIRVSARANAANTLAAMLIHVYYNEQETSNEADADLPASTPELF